MKNWLSKPCAGQASNECADQASKTEMNALQRSVSDSEMINQGVYVWVCMYVYEYMYA